MTTNNDNNTQTNKKKMSGAFDWSVSPIEVEDSSYFPTRPQKEKARKEGVFCIILFWPKSHKDGQEEEGCCCYHSLFVIDCTIYQTFSLCASFFVTLSSSYHLLTQNVDLERRNATTTV
jgi:hypothetical protein